jgi:hypothetical protein
VSGWGWSLAVALTLFGYCVGAYVAARTHEAEATLLVHTTHHEGYLEGSAGATHVERLRVEEIFRRMPERYEVFVNDWGPEHGDMRFRWAIFEADAEFDLALWPEQYDPKRDEPGIQSPYMLGNAATRALAEARALAWIAEHPLQTGPETRVVVGR